METFSVLHIVHTVKYMRNWTTFLRQWSPVVWDLNKQLPMSTLNKCCLTTELLIGAFSKPYFANGNYNATVVISKPGLYFYLCWRSLMYNEYFGEIIVCYCLQPFLMCHIFKCQTLFVISAILSPKIGFQTSFALWWFISLHHRWLWIIIVYLFP